MRHSTRALMLCSRSLLFDRVFTGAETARPRRARFDFRDLL
jgi:hypothetical protein